MKFPQHLIRDPLFHFVILGAVLFAGYSVLAPRDSVENTEHVIELTQDELLQMVVYFQSQWKRPPTQDEMSQLLEMKVQEEVLYREALALGMDKDDTIVKRRMAQKMKFIAEDVAAAYEPETEELQAWYAANSDIFAMPGRISFRQIYFSPDRRGEATRDDAAAALTQLDGQAVDADIAATLGDRIMLQDYFGDRSVPTLAKEFGPSFAQEMMDVKPGSWQGPVESGLGWHLVFVDSLEPGRVPDFTEVTADVKTAWLAEQKDIAWREAYEKMRAKYTVFLPAVPDENAALSASDEQVKSN